MGTARTSLERIVGTIALVLIAGSMNTRADEASKVMDSGQRIGQAWLKGDTVTVKKHTINNENTLKVLDIMGGWLKARKNVSDAATAKFGDQGADVLGSSGQMDLKRQLDDAEVKIDGDSAIVTPKAKPNDAAAPAAAAIKHEMYFKKDGGEWKMDLTRMDGLQHVDKMGRMFPVMEKVLNETAGEISAGKYKTPAEAKEAIQTKMIASMRAQADGQKGASGRKKPGDSSDGSR